MSTLGASPIGRVWLAMHRFGSWHADVTLTAGDLPSGRVALTVGDLELTGDVLRSQFDAPGKPHAVVVGGIGWSRELTKSLSYQSDADVRLSTVLRDLAALAGEPIEQPADRAIDRHFAADASAPRAPVQLRDVLAGLRADGYILGWRVDVDGVTRFGPRAGTAITARATELARNGGVGTRILGVDSVAAFLPGNILDGETIDRVVVSETSGSLSAEVWT